MKHGTRSRYNAGCRCEPCVIANRAYHAQRRELARERRSRRVDFSELMPADRYVADVPALEHGKHGTYTNRFCRCAPCTDAARQYMARRRATARAGP